MAQDECVMFGKRAKGGRPVAGMAGIRLSSGLGTGGAHVHDLVAGSVRLTHRSSPTCSHTLFNKCCIYRTLCSCLRI
jgi:hypothetical protein